MLVTGTWLGRLIVYLLLFKELFRISISTNLYKSYCFSVYDSAVWSLSSPTQQKVLHRIWSLFQLFFSSKDWSRPHQDGDVFETSRSMLVKKAPNQTKIDRDLIKTVSTTLEKLWMVTNPDLQWFSVFGLSQSMLVMQNKSS